MTCEATELHKSAHPYSTKVRCKWEYPDDMPVIPKDAVGSQFLVLGNHLKKYLQSNLNYKKCDPKIGWGSQSFRSNIKVFGRYGH